MDFGSKAGKEFIKKHYLKVIGVFILLFLLSLVFNASIKSVAVMALFIVIGAFSTFYFNYARVPIHFETVKLGTILCAVAYGLIPGLFVGVVSSFFGKVLVGRIDERLPVSMFAISLVAIGASLFSSVGITSLGIVLVLCYNVFIIFVSMMLGGNLAWNLTYEASNFIINLFWFTRIAPWLLMAIR